MSERVTVASMISGGWRWINLIAKHVYILRMIVKTSNMNKTRYLRSGEDRVSCSGSRQMHRGQNSVLYKSNDRPR